MKFRVFEKKNCFSWEIVSGSDYYTTSGKAVRQSCSGTCSCADGFMAATFEGSVFCLTAFFLTNDDVNTFPVCNAPCCSSYCGWYSKLLLDFSVIWKVPNATSRNLQCRQYKKLYSSVLSNHQQGTFGSFDELVALDTTWK